MRVSKQCTQCSIPFSCYALCGFDEEESQTGEVEGEQAQAGVFFPILLTERLPMTNFSTLQMSTTKGEALQDSSAKR